MYGVHYGVEDIATSKEGRVTDTGSWLVTVHPHTGKGKSRKRELGGRWINGRRERGKKGGREKDGKLGLKHSKLQSL